MRKHENQTHSFCITYQLIFLCTYLIKIFHSNFSQSYLPVSSKKGTMYLFFLGKQLDFIILANIEILKSREYM